MVKAAAPVMAYDHPLGVVDRSTFTVMRMLAGLLTDTTTPSECFNAGVYRLRCAIAWQLEQKHNRAGPRPSDALGDRCTRGSNVRFVRTGPVH